MTDQTNEQRTIAIMCDALLTGMLDKPTSQSMYRAIKEALDAAVTREREACAKVAESQPITVASDLWGGYENITADTLRAKIVKAIRARQRQEENT